MRRQEGDRYGSTVGKWRACMQREEASAVDPRYVVQCASSGKNARARNRNRTRVGQIERRGRRNNDVVVEGKVE